MGTLKSKVATPAVSEANHVEILQDSLTRRRVRATTHAKRRMESPLRLLVSRPRPITVLLILSLCAGMGQAADWGPWKAAPQSRDHNTGDSRRRLGLTTLQDQLKNDRGYKAYMKEGARLVKADDAKQPIYAQNFQYPGRAKEGFDDYVKNTVCVADPNARGQLKAKQQKAWGRRVQGSRVQSFLDDACNGKIKREPEPTKKKTIPQQPVGTHTSTSYAKARPRQPTPKKKPGPPKKKKKKKKK